MRTSEVFYSKDASDPIIRSIFFNDAPQEYLLEHQPIVALNHPILPDLHYGSLIDNAISFGDQYLFRPSFKDGGSVFGDIKFKNKSFKNAIDPLDHNDLGILVANKANGPYLAALVRKILYCDRFGTYLSYNHYTYHKDKTTKKTINRKFHSGKLLSRSSGKVEVLDGPVSDVDLMIVGKCLGYEEENRGIPFVGKGSIPLWSAWKDAGFKKISQTGGCYLTNFIKFKVENDITICPQWSVDGIHLLMQEVLLVKPKAIILLGNDVIAAFMSYIDISNDRPVRKRLSAKTSLEETITLPDLRTDTKFKTKIFFLEHPASISRRIELYPAYVNKVKLILHELSKDGIVEKSATLVSTNGSSDKKSIYDTVPYNGVCSYSLIESFDQLDHAVEETLQNISKYKYISIDTEWIGKIPTSRNKLNQGFIMTFQWSYRPGQAFVIIFRHICDNDNKVRQVLQKINRLLNTAIDSGATIVGHFFKGDLRLLSHYGINIDEKWLPPDLTLGKSEIEEQAKRLKFFDTYVASSCVDENVSKDLEKLSTYYLTKTEYAIKFDTTRLKRLKTTFDKKYLHITGTAFDDLDESIEYITATCYLENFHRNLWIIQNHELVDYCSKDVDYAGQLYLLFNGIVDEGIPGLLDGIGSSLVSVREIFARRMAAWCAVYQAEKTGIFCDVERQSYYAKLVNTKYQELLARLRKISGFDHFNIQAVQQVRYYLFGDKALAYPQDELQDENSKFAIYPPAQYIKPLNLEPVKSTKKFGELPWAEAVERFGPNVATPSVDRETIAMLLSKYPDIEGLKLLYDLSCLEVVTSTWLRDDLSSISAKDQKYDRGILNYIDEDGRVRTMFGLAETGRFTSSSPNLQNLSDQADDNVERALGIGNYADQNSHLSNRKFKLRSIFKASEGKLFINADLTNAEVCAAAWNSQDPLLLEHASRSMLPESDPNYLDLHSDLVQKAFNIDAPYHEIKKKYKVLRVAAKKIRFAHYYGGTAETIYRKLQVDPEISRHITYDHVLNILETHDKMYPKLVELFENIKKRVKTPGWLKNCFGGIRRFPMACRVDDYQLKSMEREAINWINQGLVADAIDTALGHIVRIIKEQNLQSRIVLTVHDSIMIESPIKEVQLIANEILPLAMQKLTIIKPTDLSGRPLPVDKTYHFSIDVKIYKNWEEQLDEKTLSSLGIKIQKG